MNAILVTDYTVRNVMNSFKSVFVHDMFLVISFSVILLAIALFMYIAFIKKDTKEAAILLAAYAIIYTFIELLKYFVARIRPNGELFSFPSRHAAFAFFIAYTFPARKEVKVLLYLWATLVGLSRLMLSVHWFSDVIFGAGVGLLAGFGYYFILKNMKN